VTSLPGLNSVFDIARKGLRAGLEGLNVAGNNIANVNTEGYSQQRIEFKPSPSIKHPTGIFGTGVVAAGVFRARDRVVDSQFRRENLSLKENEIKENYLRQIETIFGEPVEQGGIRQVLNRFFNSFHELANAPEDGTVRTLVRENAKVLVTVMHRIDEQLTDLNKDLYMDLSDDINKLNQIGEKIATLNKQIVSIENIGKKANDLRDERDRALDELSEIGDLYYKEESSGSMNVSIAGRTLVSDGLQVAKFKIEEYLEGDDIKARILDETTEKEISLRNGELKGIMDIRNNIIPEYRSLVDILVSKLIEQVNVVHKNGVGLEGSEGGGVPHDNDFFTGTDAGTIDIADVIKQNLNYIAAAERKQSVDAQGNITITGNPGDNKIALQIANIKSLLVFESNTISFDANLASIISKLGVETRTAADKVVAQNQILKEFTNLRDAVSGVSIDEELTNIIRYQRAYQASARVISSVDEMFQTLINM